MTRTQAKQAVTGLAVPLLLLSGCGADDPDLDPEVRDAIRLADRLWSSGNIPGAVSRLEEVAASHPRSFGARYRLGIHALDDAPREAMATLREASALAPDHPGPYFYIAMGQERLSEFDAAEAALDTAYALAQARLGFSLADTAEAAREGLHALEKLELSEAAGGFSRALETDPENPVLWFLLARARLAAGTLENASEAVRRALEHDPRFPEALALRAEIRVMRGELEPAGEDLDRARTLDPDRPYTHLVQGRLHLARREFRDAILEFWAATLGDPTVPRHHYLLGTAMLQANRPQGTMHLQHLEWANAFLGKKFGRPHFVPR